MKQKTIQHDVTLSGIGIHSGQQCWLTISPAPVNHGIVFSLNRKNFPATASLVKETRRGTTVGEIAVTEHFLAATYCLGVDNLLVSLSASELPIMDGSALPFVTALEDAQLIEQAADKNVFVTAKEFSFSANNSTLTLLPYRGLKVDFMVKFPVIGEQRCQIELNPAVFKQEIAPARTFGYIEEYELLKEQGLGRGASLENALVLSQNGYLNQPRFVDELVRHKVLDLLGDLALLGRPILGEIKAVRSGHQLNIELVRRLLNYDPT